MGWVLALLSIGVIVCSGIVALLTTVHMKQRISLTVAEHMAGNILQQNMAALDADAQQDSMDGYDDDGDDASEWDADAQANPAVRDQGQQHAVEVEMQTMDRPVDPVMSVPPEERQGQKGDNLA